MSANLKVYDVLGRSVLNRPIDLVEGTNSINLNLKDLSNATYIIEYTDVNGVAHKYKVIKQ